MANTVYGIDLGTTYSAIARINENEMSDIIPNLDGQLTTPSVVYFEESGSVVVGEEAKRSLVMDSDNAVELIKRHMGTEYPMDYQGTTYTPESISALILKSLVAGANEQLGQDIKKVVITVPAYFGVQHRQATAQAGQMAGLEVLGIVTEPVAAALSIGARGDSAETIMVYDLGGGTFDTTIMRLQEEKVEVLAIDGDRELGGADWDESLMNVVVEKFIDQAGLDENPLDDEDFYADFRLKIEDLKKSLTRRQETNINLSYEDKRESVPVTREEFEGATKHLVQKTVEISQRAVETAKKKDPNAHIDRVLLVGGSSRMPMIENALKEQLGWDPQKTDFDLAVAKGAAIYGQAADDGRLIVGDVDTDAKAAERSRTLGSGSVGGDDDQKVLEVQNVLSRGVGVIFTDDRTGKDYIEFFAHANDQIPCDPKPLTAGTMVPNQQSVHLGIYEQGGESESKAPGDNNLLNEAEFELPIKTLPKGATILMAFHITSEGLVQMKTTEPKSGATKEMEAKISILSEEQVEEETAKVNALTLRM
ncbi:Hsp70 family protein [Corynebacterium glucuronolyticum]|uniref:Hsp70 family protein n=2 Tax=Corynebacterium glucuronolyticum TaxID=39791 RepID=A0AAX1L977_9CORY|nr:Hsp70 family protein [Corynebacterium glucuronolyticum]EEI61887.1 DnaK family protein [Corynebacterium glucuronolyticum ATCC 51866]QQU88561.1 Hsp70 family protein [Corynebacterium glucuronolyticum]QRP70567.1 Hsp70 family protein [Corynebacterium glucuronolyticum]